MYATKKLEVLRAIEINSAGVALTSGPKLAECQVVVVQQRS